MVNLGLIVEFVPFPPYFLLVNKIYCLRIHLAKFFLWSKPMSQGSDPAIVLHKVLQVSIKAVQRHGESGVKDYFSSKVWS